MLSSFPNIISLVFIPLIALLPDMTIKYFSQLYWPTKSDLAIKDYLNPKENSVSVKTRVNIARKQVQNTKVALSRSPAASEVGQIL